MEGMGAMADQEKVNSETGQGQEPPALEAVIVIGFGPDGSLAYVLNGVNAIQAVPILEQVKLTVMGQINFAKKPAQGPKVEVVPGGAMNRLNALNGRKPH